jgi:hypothetical protein
VKIDLNRDFTPQAMTPQMLLALFQAVQGGRISQRTFFDNLQRGEIIDADTRFEDEQSEIEESSDETGMGGLREMMDEGAEGG